MSEFGDRPAELDGARIVVIGHAATKWALDNLLDGVTLEGASTAPYTWQPGWEYVLER